MRPKSRPRRRSGGSASAAASAETSARREFPSGTSLEQTSLTNDRLFAGGAKDGSPAVEVRDALFVRHQLLEIGSRLKFVLHPQDEAMKPSQPLAALAVANLCLLQ